MIRCYSNTFHFSFFIPIYISGFCFNSSSDRVNVTHQGTETRLVRNINVTSSASSHLNQGAMFRMIVEMLSLILSYFRRERYFYGFITNPQSTTFYNKHKYRKNGKQRIESELKRSRDTCAVIRHVSFRAVC